MMYRDSPPPFFKKRHIVFQMVNTLMFPITTGMYCNQGSFIVNLYCFRIPFDSYHSASILKRNGLTVRPKSGGGKSIHSDTCAFGSFKSVSRKRMEHWTFFVHHHSYFGRFSFNLVCFVFRASFQKECNPFRVLLQDYRKGRKNCNGLQARYIPSALGHVSQTHLLRQPYHCRR